MHRVIQLHEAAPAKPRPGEPCNGCGLCCAAEPCPLGMLASGRTQGRCAALVFRPAQNRYRCGLIEQPRAHLPRGLKWAGRLVARLAWRYVAAGVGCDCHWDAVAGTPR